MMDSTQQHSIEANNTVGNPSIEPIDHLFYIDEAHQRLRCRQPFPGIGGSVWLHRLKYRWFSLDVEINWLNFHQERHSGNQKEGGERR